MLEGNTPKMCKACGLGVAPGGAYVRFAGAVLHAACFKCADCGKALSGVPYVLHAGKPYCAADYKRRFAPKCSRCHEPLEGSVVKLGGKELHTRCFCCAVCSTPLSPKAFWAAEDGTPYCARHSREHCGRPCAECGKKLLKFYEREGQAFCEEHYKKRFGKQCGICGARNLEWAVNFWGDAFCKEHTKELPNCQGCGRLVPATTSPLPQQEPAGFGKALQPLQQRSSVGADYADGRSMCAACLPKAVHEQATAQSLLGQVLAFFGQLGVAVTDVTPPVALLERNALQELCQQMSSPHAVHRCPLGVTCARHCSAMSGGRQVASSHEVQQVACLSGLTRAQLSAVLAHEAGHVYLELAGCTQLAPHVAEGVCELFSYLWLQQGAAGSKEERSYLVHMIENNAYRIYSEGFRSALAAFYANSSSLVKLLVQVKTTRTLPVAARQRRHGVPAAGAPARPSKAK